MNSIKREGIGMTSQRTRERLVNRLIEQGIQRIDVLEAIRTMPRHLFIDEALSHRAYEDVALPIGFNQTISQPYIVARMTEVILNAAPDDAVILEIGTGCGYQTAILAQMVKHVYSIERIRPLLEKTRDRSWVAIKDSFDISALYEEKEEPDEEGLRADGRLPGRYPRCRLPKSPAVSSVFPWQKQPRPLRDSFPHA